MAERIIEKSERYVVAPDGKGLYEVRDSQSANAIPLLITRNQTQAERYARGQNKRQ